MPDMDGWEVLDKMEAVAKYRDIPVIIVTVKEQRDTDKTRVSEHRMAKAFVNKPFAISSLIEKVKRVLNDE